MPNSFNSGLLVFTNDLRLHDNPALLAAARQSVSLGCVYIDDRKQTRASDFGLRGFGSNRDRFLRQSLEDLNEQLKHLGQHLYYDDGSFTAKIAELVNLYNIEAVFYSVHAGLDERRRWQALMKAFASVHFFGHHSSTLFEADQLVYPEGFPATYSKFRKNAEKWPIVAPRPTPDSLPPSFLPKQRTRIQENGRIKKSTSKGLSFGFRGGERAGLKHLKTYFSSGAAQAYKSTRNALDGWSASTKFSPWLATGCLSARFVYRSLREHEDAKGANEDTYWIFFELLWREYFQWYAHAHDAKLFRFRGLAKTSPLTSFYPERFRKWIEGCTPFPLVNACMNQLSHTGFMSNRGRQIVASCLVNELSLDWRIGAAYFEQQLIDYDVASNWGNWQYIAGVGADPRGGRHFNIEKQTAIYDPDGDFIDKWTSAPAIENLDSVDAADWPIEP